tara:strand:+ start:2692 stop:2877 length:186 start_codon:yes stop_codon:yes gene_type:complete
LRKTQPKSAKHAPPDILSQGVIPAQRMELRSRKKCVSELNWPQKPETAKIGKYTYIDITIE